MYDYDWDLTTGGYTLIARNASHVASEIRPVYAEELRLLGFDRHFRFDSEERRPLAWARQGVYFSWGHPIAKIVDISPRFLVDPGETLRPVNVEAMVAHPQNVHLMTALVADTQKRLKSIYDRHIKRNDLAYIAFSGGKDSMLLLDLCHRTLPFSVPVVFSETGMDLPGTKEMWEEVQKRYPERPFLLAKAPRDIIRDWEDFGPPAQRLRWCCTVRKTSPSLTCLKAYVGKASARFLAFIGVRGDESPRRSAYDDVGVGVKSEGQTNAMPILSWGAHELFLYTFVQRLPIHSAYRFGIPRVGCLVCPMASSLQTQLLRRVYPEETRRFEKAIAGALDRPFTDAHDMERFIVEGGWRTRCSGLSLRQVMAPPEVRQEKCGAVAFSSPALDANRALEWFKALGTTTFRLSAKEKELRVASLDGTPLSKAQVKAFAIVAVKAMACVGCGACEAVCPTGALSIREGRVRIDTERCSHCGRCFAQPEGCQRFYSIRYAGGQSMSMKSMDKYRKFGLRSQWLGILLETKARFSQEAPLGEPMIYSAKTWFREATLISQGSAIEPTALVEVAARLGVEDAGLWEAIWVTLANRSPLVKWFVLTARVGERMTREDLNDALVATGAQESARNGALQSLCDLLKSSPLGHGANPLVDVEMKGRSVVAVTRRARVPKEWAVLYGLFAMAQVTGRNAFSISRMMATEADCVSPATAFGMDLETFQGICQSLADRNGDFVKCVFTAGLDEVTVKTDSKTLDNVAALAD